MQIFQIISAPLVWIAELLILHSLFTQYKEKKVNLMTCSVIQIILIVINVISGIYYFRYLIPLMFPC